MRDLFTPELGKTPSLHKQILDAFLAGERLSVVSALQRFRTIELRKFVSDIRKEGFPISDLWEKNPSTKKRFKVYFLDK
ncbi:MAG TPA: helix-turn-helix domain-containing protein [Bacteroidales bacterium]|nr:helix-turn-helix domain-containing protein [Bacteroidales bacterium]